MLIKSDSFFLFYLNFTANVLYFLLKVKFNVKTKRCFPYRLVNPSAVLTLRWHFDFYIVKIGMPQKGLDPPTHKALEDRLFYKNPLLIYI